ncbi:MAG: hypothetical protein GEU90_21640 [Gemmatimonas sp.]|nr:hypothetical protein [Gemmatimonas sp.]
MHTVDVSSTIGLECIRSATLLMASAKFRSAGAVSTGFDSPTISSICTRPVPSRHEIAQRGVLVDRHNLGRRLIANRAAEVAEHLIHPSTSTGLHALHMIVGIGIIAVITWMAYRGKFASRATKTTKMAWP